MNSAKGRIGELIYLGEVAQYQFNTAEHSLKIFELNPLLEARPQDVDLYATVAPNDVVVIQK